MRIRFFYTAVLFLSLVAVSSCGGDDPLSTVTDSGTPRADSGTRTDASAEDAGAADAGVGPDSGADLDSGVASDAGTGTDAAAATDAGVGAACAAGSAIDDRSAGVCDGRGRAICIMWATMSGGAGATAECTPGGMGRCGRGDACGSAGCTCGGSPECADDQMCVLDPAGGLYACRCIIAAPTP